MMEKLQKRLADLQREGDELAAKINFNLGQQEEVIRMLTEEQEESKQSEGAEKSAPA